MSDRKLRELLAQLRSAVSGLPGNAADAHSRLDGIVAELERTLDDPDRDRRGLVDSIHETVQEIEARHPDATTVLNNIMMTLANMGI